MHIEILKIIIPVMLAFSAFVWKLISGYQKTITTAIETLRNEIHNMQIDIAKNYVMYQNYDKDSAANTASHALIHDKINQLSERVKAVEVVQEHCPTCNK
jgi:cell fate (sporulation/competence/biofilm development) regulator YmcA (YheA/YmcA/DUF963 family)